MTDELLSPRLARLGAELSRERGNLRRLTVEARAALDELSERSPSSLELRGAGDLIHDYYSGVEKVFILVAETIDGGNPEGDCWHRRLLDAMALELRGLRPPLIAGRTVAALDPLLKFRQLFRNIYRFDLEWERVRALLERVEAVQGMVESDLATFKATMGLPRD